jgi:hypothetical protein
MSDRAIEFAGTTLRLLFTLLMQLHIQAQEGHTAGGSHINAPDLNPY